MNKKSFRGFFATFFTIIFVGLVSFSCQEKEDSFQNGDLIFVGIPMDYTLAFDSVDSGKLIVVNQGVDTNINYIHVGILELEGDSSWVIDATIRYGISRRPLSVFMQDFTLPDGKLPRFDVMRLQDNSKVDLYVGNAKKFCGRPYNSLFSRNTDSLYCSQLVYESYINADGKRIFSEGPMNFKNKDGEFPPYWTWLFGVLNQEIPQDKLGILPAAIAESECVRLVGEM